jgi:glycosyltransferase involved in cell wall biosynthesis
MACGTPALTFDVQGPSEYVLNDRTGWLAHTDEELEQRSVELWKEKYPRRIRSECLKAASKFDKKLYTQKWLKMLTHKNATSDEFLKIEAHKSLPELLPGQ